LIFIIGDRTCIGLTINRIWTTSSSRSRSVDPKKVPVWPSYSVGFVCYGLGERFPDQDNPKNLTLDRNRRTPSNTTMMKVIPDLFWIHWTWCTRRPFHIQKNQTGVGISPNRGSNREWHLYKVCLRFERVRQGFRPSHIWVWFWWKTRRRRVDHVQWMQKSVGMTCMFEGVRLLGFRVRVF
jgi:hypothetical protein